MQQAIWSSYLLELPIEDMVRTFSKHGWSCAELSDEHARMLLDRGSPAVVGTAFRTFMNDFGFSFPQGHLWLGADIALLDSAARRVHIDIVKQWCDLFVALGVKAAVLHPGGFMLSAVLTQNELAEIRYRALEELINHIADTDMVICLENCYHLIPDAYGLLAILEPFDPAHTGICFDTGHQNITRGDFREFIMTAGSQLKATHINDNLGERDDHMMPYGRGTVPWADVLGALREIGYHNVFNFEIPGECRCPLETRLAKLDYIKRLGEQMIAEIERT